ncbi:hypothetical protein QWY85_11400 [Neolewinella lacunae]|uniref:Uncharacterized protein n=1 Tax=Neolewinella lacunae TaxID=1517758 RepID=A0A923T990_9BACT|nr:hypothetical protein [Neolewinella lacunae]MBC6996475.1 hypothetical protein [Neolewinella lacunae]MDN3635266.1 hypothetical protein [Neolewinella lacunae]
MKHAVIIFFSAIFLLIISCNKEENIQPNESVEPIAEGTFAICTTVTDPNPDAEVSPTISLVVQRG